MICKHCGTAENLVPRHDRGTTRNYCRDCGPTGHRQPRMQLPNVAVQHGHSMSYVEIGELLGLTPQRVEQIEKQALAKLHAHMLARGVTLAEWIH